MKDADSQIIQLLREIKAAASGGAGAVWGAITGTLSSQTDLQSALDAKQTAAQVNALIAAAVPYKVYTALLTQSSTDAPVATVLQNTFPAEMVSQFVWTRQATGQFLVTVDSNTFTAGKTAVITSADPVAKTGMHFLAASLTDSDLANISFFTFAADGTTETDGVMTNDFIEIRVYNP